MAAYQEIYGTKEGPTYGLIWRKYMIKYQEISCGERLKRKKNLAKYITLIKDMYTYIASEHVMVSLIYFLLR
jgi:hypothetical protein